MPALWSLAMDISCDRRTKPGVSHLVATERPPTWPCRGYARHGPQPVDRSEHEAGEEHPADEPACAFRYGYEQAVQP